jgi:hypothetical protein
MQNQQDVVENHLRKLPNPEHAAGNSDRKGLHDAWCTKLMRIQSELLAGVCCARTNPTPFVNHL